MQTLLKHQIPVASSCQGDGVCGKCVLDINIEHSELNPLEVKLKTKFNWRKNQRASCQIEIKSNLEITSTYW